MKIVKKLGLLSVAVIFVFALAACTASRISTDITISSDKGAGTKTVTATILKDGAKDSLGQDVVDNDKFFVAGGQPIADWLKANVPAGYTVDFAETAEKMVFSITYSFNDLADYNAKTKALITDARWADKGLKEATLTVEAADGGSNVTFTEDANVSEQSIMQYYEQIYANPDLIDPGDTAIADSYKMQAAVVNVGGTASEIDMETPTVVTGAGFVAEGSVAAPAVTNPATGDAGVTLYIMLALLSVIVAVAFVYYNRKARNAA